MSTVIRATDWAGSVLLMVLMACALLAVPSAKPDVEFRFPAHPTSGTATPAVTP